MLKVGDYWDGKLLEKLQQENREPKRGNVFYFDKIVVVGFKSKYLFVPRRVQTKTMTPMTNQQDIILCGCFEQKERAPLCLSVYPPRLNHKNEACISDFMPFVVHTYVNTQLRNIKAECSRQSL